MRRAVVLVLLLLLCGCKGRGDFWETASCQEQREMRCLQALDSIAGIHTRVLPRCETEHVKCVEELLRWIGVYDALPITPCVASIHGDGQTVVGGILVWTTMPPGPERDGMMKAWFVLYEELLDTCQAVADLGEAQADQAGPKSLGRLC